MNVSNLYLEVPYAENVSEINDILDTYHKSIMNQEMTIDEGIAKMNEEVGKVLYELECFVFVIGYARYGKSCDRTECGTSFYTISMRSTHYHTWRSAVQLFGVLDGQHSILDGEYDYFKLPDNSVARTVM